MVNVIVYDGTSKYTPPAGLTLRQVNTAGQIGDRLAASQKFQQPATSRMIYAP